MLSRLIERAANANPDKAAVVWGSERITFASLADRIERCAAGLVEEGVVPGDCVAIILPNRPEFVLAFFAAIRVAAIVAPVSPQMTVAELDRIFSDAHPRVLICDFHRLAACREVVDHAANRIRLIVVGGEGHDDFDRLGAAAAVSPVEGTPDSRALYLYTSGSTDTFKRVCCTQSNLWFEALNFVESTQLGKDDSILCAVPLHHSYGLGNGLLDAMYLGATLVLETGEDIPFAARHAGTLQTITTEGIRVFLGVPFQFDVLAKSDQDVEAAFRDVAWCISSGDLLRRQTFERFLVRTGCPIRSLYGSTEAGSIAMNTGRADGVRFGDLGKGLSNVVIESRGEAGELWVKSRTLPPNGYDNRPELNATVFRDGFYNTGDFGKFDDRGHLFMTGRKQSFVDVGGRKVDLAEVEEVLLSHPDVREAAAIGIEVPNLGGVIKAVVAAHEACREESVLDHCRKHLATFKIPRFVEFRELLPRSPLGKVLRKNLSDSVAGFGDVPLARTIPALLRPAQIDWLGQRIQEQVATILRSHHSAVPRNVPFQSLGFDSLRAIELQERLSLMSGVALSIGTLWNYTSIDAYAAFLLDAMNGPAPANSTKAADPLDAFTDEEIVAMLAHELDPKSAVDDRTSK